MTSDKWLSNPTQIVWVCRALIDGQTISPKTEIREVRGWRLGAIIHTLRTAYDWPIAVEYRGPENVAYYSLDDDAEPASLRFPPSANHLQTGEV